MVNFCFLWINEKICFPFQETTMLTISFFENWDLEWYSRSDINSNDKLILVLFLS